MGGLPGINDQNRVIRKLHLACDKCKEAYSSLDFSGSLGKKMICRIIF
jgi:hypothetical protein